MRAAPVLAALAALVLAAAGCSVVTEGAPCETSASCPAGQGCGADLKCSVRALTCTACRPGEKRCLQGGVATCAAAANGVCSAFGEPVQPGSHQICVEPSGGDAQLTCAATSCTVEGTATCTAATQLTTCALDGATGCLYDSVASCDVPQVCSTSGGVACRCPDDGGSAGQGCSAQAVGATTCDPAKANVVTCGSVGACKVWVAKACTNGMVCGHDSGTWDCQCPANGGSDFYADPVAGKPKGAFPFPNGTLNPPQCRFSKLGDALSAANSIVATTGTARTIATGWNGMEVVFKGEITSTKPLDVLSGVTLTTTDSPFTVNNYVIAVDVAGAAGAVKLEDGATFSGFKVRNAVTSGAAPIAGVVVPGSNATTPAPVTLQAIRVEGIQAPPPATPKPIGTGITIAGGALLTATDVSVTGAGGSGVTVSDAATTPVPFQTVAVFHSSTLQGNGKDGLEVLAGAKVTVDQGTVVANNTEHGLAVRGSELVVSGTDAAPIDIGSNVIDGILSGVDGSSCKLTVNHASIHGNATGIEVVNNDGSGNGQPVSISETSLTGNTSAGLKVLRSSPLSPAAPSLHVSSVQIAGGKNGVLLQPAPSGSVIDGAFSSVSITGASDGGVFANSLGGSSLSIEGSTISGNCGVTPRGTAQQIGGGIVFFGSLPTMTSFKNNHVSANQHHQILVVAGSTNSISLSPGACTGQNQFICSGGASGGFGVYSTGASVNATFNAWTDEPPNSQRDFSANVDPIGATTGDWCSMANNGCVSPPASCP